MDRDLKRACPTNRQVDKKVVVHTYNGILAIRKSKILPFVTACMDLESTMLSKISQSEKYKYQVISLTHEI